MLQSAIKRAAHRFGFDIRRCPPVALPDRQYQRVYPTATYCPWKGDACFQRLYSLLQPFTLVDEYRCFELWQLVRQSAKLHEGALIEVGVWQGGTAALIATQAMKSGIEDSVFLCDTFAGVVKAGPLDSQYRGGEHADVDREAVEGLLNALKLDNTEILQGIFPDQTGNAVQDLRFRFCHIDVDVYQSAQDILDWIWPRMVSGGMVVYDDFGFENCNGITKHVEAQIPCADRFILHNLNGHAIVIKR